MENNTSGLEEFVHSFFKMTQDFSSLFEKESLHQNLLEENIRLIKEKKYAVTDQIWSIQNELHNVYFLKLMHLVQSFAGEYAADMMKLLAMAEANTDFAQDFIRDILTNRQKKIVDLARQRELSEDFIIFISTFAAMPYRRAAAAIVKQTMPLDEHISGYCPVCGHWPVMSYLAGNEGKKYMACICCGTHWSFRRLLCPFCLNTNADELGYLNIKEEKVYSAYTCSKCRRYLKSKKTAAEPGEMKHEQIILDFLNSGDIDVAAVQNKFIHEPLLGTRFQGPEDKHIDTYIARLFQD